MVDEKINEVEDLEENTKKIMIEEETDIKKIFKWCDKLEKRLERFRHSRKGKKINSWFKISNKTNISDKLGEKKTEKKKIEETQIQKIKADLHETNLRVSTNKLKK